MTENFTLRECSNCHHWKPKNFSHLCNEGNCFVILNKPVPKNRNDFCNEGEEGNYTPIEGEL